MGWVLGTEVGHPFVWHNGETYAYTAFNGMFPDDGFSVALLTNGAVNEDTPFLNSSLILYTTLPTAPPKYKRNT